MNRAELGALTRRVEPWLRLGVGWVADFRDPGSPAALGKVPHAHWRAGRPLDQDRAAVEAYEAVSQAAAYASLLDGLVRSRS